MHLQPFAKHFPVTASHFDSFIRGMPHEQFSQKKSKKGKKVCRILLLRKAVQSPISIPFLTGYSFFLTLLKLAEAEGRVFSLLNPTEKHVKGFVATCKQVTDYLILTFIMPVKIVAEIIRLAVAMFFGSHICFSPPKTYPTNIQKEYYQKCVDNKFYKFRFSRNATLQIKAEIREIEHVHEKILSELVNDEDKITFLKKIIRHLKIIDPDKIDSKNLNSLREFCLKVARRNDIKLEFKTPKKDSSETSCSSLSGSWVNFTDEDSNDFYSCTDSNFGGNEIDSHKSPIHSL